MSYGQFWDVRVTYGGAYDFDAANVDQMQHQLLKNALVLLRKSNRAWRPSGPAGLSATRYG